MTYDGYDPALEASRRVAWSRYYRCRDDLVRLARWAGEVALWMDELVDRADMPPGLVELLDMLEAPLDDLDRLTIGRYVRHHAREHRQHTAANERTGT